MTKKGKKKEGRVANKLKNLGYKILARNKIIKFNQYKKGEIDIIAKKGKTKYAVEVKSGRQVITSTVIQNIVKKAKKIKARPLLIVGPKVRITEKAREFIERLKVKLKTI